MDLKHQIQELDLTILELEKEKNIEKLQLLISKLKKDIINIIVLIDNEKASPVLSVKIIKPITNLINEIRESIPSGRRRKSERKDSLKKIEILNSFLKDLFCDYSSLIKNNESFIEYQKEKIQSRDFILYPDEIDGIPFEFLGLNTIKEHLEGCEKSTLTYFKNQITEKDSSQYKTEIFQFISELNSQITSLELELEREKDFLNEFKIKNIEEGEISTLKNNSKKAQTNPHKENDFFDYEEIRIERYFSLLEFIDYKECHLNILKSLKVKLFDAHIILKEYDESKDVPLTVFGDRDFNRIENLFYAMSPILDSSISKSQFLKCFSNSGNVSKKLNLANGTLADYGSLIIEMREHFTSSISTGANYADWWAERFKFNNVDKNKKDIQRMWSLKKVRGTTRRHTLEQIRYILSISPQ